VNLETVRKGKARSFTHTKYWELGPEGEATPQVLELRKALNLVGQVRDV